MKKRLLIIGASGHGKVIADIALKMKKWNDIVFLDDNLLTRSNGLEIIGKLSDAYTYIDDSDIFVAIGDNYIREKIMSNLEDAGANIPLIVHPNAVIGEQVELAVGTVIMAGVVINPYTRIGKGCIVNTGATIDHDNIIDDYVHISPGANLAGSVNIGKNSWIGIGSIVINNISITNNCKIGAGAVVVKNITKPGTYIGIPAKQINF